MQLGSLKLESPFMQAGLAGYSDAPMRVVARRRGCTFAVTEALGEEYVVQGGKQVQKGLRVGDDDHPLAGQIMGSTPSQMAAAARILHASGHDVIDVNLACPVRKQSRPRGGHLLNDTALALDILKAVRDALPPSVPATVKLRRGTDTSDAAAERFEAVLEGAWAAGYDAVCVHGRTVTQGYIGPSDWDFLRRLKARYPRRTLIGSGDVFAAADALALMTATGMDGAWIARGAIGNPWIFAQARSLMANTPLAADPPRIREQRQALEEHLELAMAHYGTESAAVRLRSVGIRYTRFHPEEPDVRKAFLNCRTLEACRQIFERWYTVDGPGIRPERTVVDECNRERTKCSQ
jgi:tRNA-dihydrouridine synthase B